MRFPNGNGLQSASLLAGPAITLPEALSMQGWNVAEGLLLLQTRHSPR